MRDILTEGKSLLDLKPGDSLKLPRRIYEVRGFADGGMGRVIFLELSNDPSNSTASVLPSNLALKIIKSNHETFLPELQKWGGMMHKHILPLEEILHSPQEGMVAASRRCPGSLRTLMRQVGCFSTSEAYSVIRSCASALEYAFHEHGVVHLDVKPENILFIENLRGLEHYRYLLADWGISTSKFDKHVNDGSLLTHNNSGTIPYMAPERFQHGVSSSVASDIFSLGILWIELLCGKLPYSSGKNIIHQIISGEYVSTANQLMREAKIGKRLQSILTYCIHPDSKKRIADWPIFHNKIKQGLFTLLFR